MAKKTEIKTEKIEREYVIPLREKCRNVVRYKKSNRAIKTIKEFLVRHMKIRDRDLNKIKVDKYVNEFIWSRGIKNPPHKVKVKAIKEGVNVNVELADMSKKFEFKKAREEKREVKAQEFAEKKKSLMQKAQEGMQAKPVKAATETKTDVVAEKEKQESVKEKAEETTKKEASKKDKTTNPEKELKEKKAVKQKKEK